MRREVGREGGRRRRSECGGYGHERSGGLTTVVWGLEQDAVTMVISLVGTSVHSYMYVHTCTCPLTFSSLCVPPVVPSVPQWPPTLTTLTCFKTSSGSINVAERIGPQYLTFGIQLLKDDTGAIIDAIEEECHHKAYKINLKILRRWIEGQGRRPLTWATLINVLRDTQLAVLASEIEHNL